MKQQSQYLRPNCETVLVEQVQAIATSTSVVNGISNPFDNEDEYTW